MGFKDTSRMAHDLLFRALEHASCAIVHLATHGAMNSSLCALAWLTQSRWRHVLDVLCLCRESDHTARSFERCFCKSSGDRE